MADRQPLKATFFTLQNRPRAVLLPATFVLVVGVALIVAAFLALNWNTLRDFPALFAQLPSKPEEKADPTVAMHFIGGMFGLFGWGFLLLFPFFMLLAAYEAACLRWMIRGEAPGLFGVAFNSVDTWRVYGVYWCWIIGQYVVSFAMGIVMMPFMFASMGELVRNGGHPDMAAMWHWQMTVQLPLALLQYAPLIFLGVRFAPAAATSIARRRFSFFEAWTVTTHRWLAMLGSFALLWVIMALALAVIFAVTVGPIVARLWPEFWPMWMKPSPEAMQKYFAAFFTPTTLVLFGIAYAAQAIAYFGYKLMTFGVNARAALVALDEGKIKVEPATD